MYGKRRSFNAIIRDNLVIDANFGEPEVLENKIYACFEVTE